MAPQIKGTAIYKKKQGTFNISNDEKSILWHPSQPKDAPPGVNITVASISNLQQTPETASKVILKIFEKSHDQAEPVTHLFHFNSPIDARAEANAIKAVLTRLISASKATDPNIPRANGAGSTSAAMAIASAVTSTPGSGSARWYDDAQLKADFKLQQSLMKQDPKLLATYMESAKTKPQSISDGQFNTQFWSTRTNILREHAVEINQKRGAYNVLSVVKPRQGDPGELKLNITKEQINLIFSQHPLVQRIYDENVPKLDEAEFWSRFFMTRLFKKLKGERIMEADHIDHLFDRYLNATDDDGLSKRLQESRIPHIIDLEGNEENQGGTKTGNQKDFTMRPGSAARVPIVRTLNSLSEKIMAHVAPSDIDPANPIGMDKETFNSLALRDLQGNADENRIMLNIKEQSRFFSSDKSEVSVEAALYAKQVPAEVLIGLQTDLDPSMMDSDVAGGLDLRSAIGVLEDSDSEEEDEEKAAHVGNKASMADAQKQILEGIKARRAELQGPNESDRSGLSEKIYNGLRLSQATTTEFLHHFWLIFLSGDPDRAGELAKMVETLDRSMDRINAVAADAEKEREQIIQKQKQHIRDVYEQSGKKIRWDPKSVGGGEKVVKEMMEPTIKALQKASKEYRKALTSEGIDASAA